MKNSALKSFAALMTIGAFFSVSFAQTKLSLDCTNIVHVTGEDKTLDSAASVNYKIDLKKVDQFQ